MRPQDPDLSFFYERVTARENPYQTREGLRPWLLGPPRSFSSSLGGAEQTTTVSSQAPITVADNLKTYADVSASNRWSTILKVDDPKVRAKR